MIVSQLPEKPNYCVLSDIRHIKIANSHVCRLSITPNYSRIKLSRWRRSKFEMASEEGETATQQTEDCEEEEEGQGQGLLAALGLNWKLGEDEGKGEGGGEEGEEEGEPPELPPYMKYLVEAKDVTAVCLEELRQITRYILIKCLEIVDYESICDPCAGCEKCPNHPPAPRSPPPDPGEGGVGAPEATAMSTDIGEPPGTDGDGTAEETSGTDDSPGRPSGSGPDDAAGAPVALDDSFVTAASPDDSLATSPASDAVEHEHGEHEEDEDEHEEDEEEEEEHE